MVSCLMTGGRGTISTSRPARKPRKDASPVRRRDNSDDSGSSSVSDHEPQKDRKKREPGHGSIKSKHRGQRSPGHASREANSAREQGNEKKTANSTRHDVKSAKTGEVRERSNRDGKRSADGHGKIITFFLLQFPLRYGHCFLALFERSILFSGSSYLSMYCVSY